MVLVIRTLRRLMRDYRSLMIFLIIGLMLGSLYSVVQGPTTLEIPRDALNFENFRLLFFVIGGAIILGLQAMKGWIEKKETNS